MKPLLAEAADLPPAARERFVAERCADPELRREILALLASPAPLTNIVGAPSLPPGRTLGRYVIEQLVGRGGMGEVYRARDSKLSREVAIKVLPPLVAADRARVDRFAREARLLAALNHPHICTLHDVDTQDEIDFLVMEYVEGETLAERLQKGPIPLERTLTIATEIAEALASAHRRDVIHRDLKPGNIMLTKTGTKLLDFGLAKLIGHDEQAAVASLVSVPAPSAPLTGEGVIAGTLQYMAPEQVEGKPADARTDLWALGAIVYEMVTGTRAFEGASAAGLIAAILESEPAPLSARQPLAPPALDRLVRRCLAKAPDDRPDTAHDLASELRGIRETIDAAAQSGGPRGRWSWRAVGWIAASIVAVALGGAGVTLWLASRGRPMSPAGIVRTDISVRPADELKALTRMGGWMPTPGGSRTALTWTPDGQALVFVGRRAGVQQLYVRRLDDAEARVIPNTENAEVPAVSADGKWVAFWVGGKIKKVPFEGGPVLELMAGMDWWPPPWGLVWDSQQRLFFGREGTAGIWEIPAAGDPKAVTTVADGQLAHGLPWPLPGGRALLYTVYKRSFTAGDDEIWVLSLATGSTSLLLRDAADPRYVPSGHLVFLRLGQLFAVPFDVERVTLRGRPVPVLDSVAQALVANNSSNITRAGQFSTSATGALAWVSGPVSRHPDSVLVKVDLQGRPSVVPGPARAYELPLRLSPDGRRLAVGIRTPTDAGLFLVDLERGGLTALPGGGEVSFPRWSPDAKYLLFSWLKDGRLSLASQPADGSAPPEVLAVTDFIPSSVTRDGQQIIGTNGNGTLLATAEIDGARARVRPLPMTHNELLPELSPDGRWLAYSSAASGGDRLQVYVRSYPGPGDARPVTIDGGVSPAWHPSGRELFYLSSRSNLGKRRMMAVRFEPSSPPRLGTPRALFEFAADELIFNCVPVRCYDVGRDGQHFYVTQPRTSPLPPPVTHINLVQNWLEQLKARVPVR
jgi:serine/threonine-protein kinase